MSNLTKITLTGQLAELYGAEHEFYIDTPKDAIAALDANYPGFKQHLRDSSTYYQLLSERHPEGIEELDEFAGKELVFVEVIEGSGAAGKVFLGVALVAASIAITFPTLGGGTSLGLLGASLILGGVAEWLTPSTPLAEAKEDEQKSSTIDLNNPTTSRDTPVPLCYGSIRIKNPPILSAGSTTSELAAD
ncbi:MAG TPA: hypothetical protein V6C84_18920 [Coleofasciculaceae cyanobacterium]|jgi:predicted phage tail protein